MVSISDLLKIVSSSHHRTDTNKMDKEHGKIIKVIDVALCGNISKHDRECTEFATRIVALGYSIVFYVAMLLLSVFGVFFKACEKFPKRVEVIFFLTGILLVSLSIFVNSSDLTLTLYQRIASAFLVGIVFVLFGASLFFSRPTPSSYHCTLSRQQPSMGLVVSVITVPLIITEILLFLGAESSKDGYRDSRKKLRVLILVDGLVSMIQKFLQLIIYLYLRNRTARPCHKKSAIFYLKILAFYNFIQWVDNQVNAENDIGMNRARQVYSEWFDVLVILYKALIIDYRLLCSLLLLEHSVELQIQANVDGRVHGSEGDDRVTRYIMTVSDRHRRMCGFIIGFFCFISPFLCAVFYIHKLHISSLNHIFATFLNSSCIVVTGTLILRKNRLDFDERDKESVGVKIMVS